MRGWPQRAILDIMDIYALSLAGRGAKLVPFVSDRPGAYSRLLLNVRVEGTSVLRDMRATRGTPHNVAEQRN